MMCTTAVRRGVMDFYCVEIALSLAAPLRIPSVGDGPQKFQTPMCPGQISTIGSDRLVGMNLPTRTPRP